MRPRSKVTMTEDAIATILSSIVDTHPAHGLNKLYLGVKLAVDFAHSNISQLPYWIKTCGVTG